MDSATNTESSSKRSRTAGNAKQPDNWLRRPDPWEVARLEEAVEVQAELFIRTARAACCVLSSASPLFCSAFHSIGRSSATVARRSIRSALWAASTPDYFDFQQFSRGDFVGALAETLTAESLTRVLYPDDYDVHGPGIALLAGIFPRRLLAGRSRAALPARQHRTGTPFPRKSLSR